MIFYEFYSNLIKLCQLYYFLEVQKNLNELCEFK
jgi:hypothetical protein